MKKGSVGRRPRPSGAGGRRAPPVVAGRALYPRGLARPVRRIAEEREKTIYDPVHGPIGLSGAPLAVIGEPTFQRLWGVRQTGFAHLVFPGANHTRLEHSLGVYWVSRRMAETLGLDRAASAEIACGALLHDVGHAPFSHTLDGPMREALGYDHERQSRWEVLGGRATGGAADPSELPSVLERHGIAPARVAALIDPSGGPPPPPLHRAILHGPIDADRIDYLQRDAHYTGVAHGAIDATRLLHTIGSVGGRLSFAEKGRSAVEGFLLGRTLMYSAVYYHKTVRAAELMLSAGVERTPGFPETVRPWFRATDGELLSEMHRTGGFPGRIAKALRERRLYKRVAGRAVLTPEEERTVRRRWSSPPDRRAAEDELARIVGAPEGAVLFDLSGAEERRENLRDLEEIRLHTGRRALRPFARHGPWHGLLARAPGPWALALYVHPGHRRTERSRWPRLLDQML